jgi:hypothetical protein
MTDTSLLDAPAPIDRFRSLLMADPALQQRLSVIAEQEAFVDAMIAAASEAGIAITADEADAGLNADPLGTWRFSGAPITSYTAPEGDWLPIAIVPSMGELAVDWAHFAGRPLSDSFFEDSLRRARHRPLNRLARPRTPLQALAAPAGEEARAPAGFVFHQSRCGSTLVSQMLAADVRNVVVSEAAPIDSIVQLVAARTDVPVEQRIALLRAIVGALGRDRLGGGGDYVVKLDSWHTLALPLFRLAFPDTPWIFLYRDPVEILVSHARMAGAQTVAGAMSFEPYGIENAAEMAPDDYAARALGRTAEAVIEHLALGGGMLVNYTELPDAVEARVLPHFGIVPDEQGRAALAAASGRDAKAPLERFARDSDAKQQAANEKLRANAALHMDEPYRQLEGLRRAGEK